MPKKTLLRSARAVTEPDIVLGKHRRATNRSMRHVARPAKRGRGLVQEIAPFLIASIRQVLPHRLSHHCGVLDDSVECTDCHFTRSGEAGFDPRGVPLAISHIAMLMYTRSGPETTTGLKVRGAAPADPAWQLRRILELN